jgi:hypothetical protein
VTMEAHLMLCTPFTDGLTISNKAISCFLVLALEMPNSGPYHGICLPQQRTKPKGLLSLWDASCCVMLRNVHAMLRIVA